MDTATTSPVQQIVCASRSAIIPLLCNSRLFKAIAIACFLMASSPVLQWYANRAADGSDEPLGVLSLATALGLLALRLRDSRLRHGITCHAPCLLAGALILACVEFTPLRHFPLFSGLVAIMVLSLSVHLPSGKAGFVALLVLSLPLIASLDFYGGYPLRVMATHLSVWLLNLIGLGVERAGVLILDGGTIVGMDPPCAGVRMLWTACFTAAVVATCQRLMWQRTLQLIAGALICVVLGNGLRAALVFFPESGRIQAPEWLHPGIGLVVHAGVLFAVFSLGEFLTGRRRQSSHAPFRRRRTLWFATVLIALGITPALWLLTTEASPLPSSQSESKWPTTLQGVPLVPLPLSAREARFAHLFPGNIAKFHCGEKEVIFRRVTHATRFMHPAGDCLTAAGFNVTSKPLHRDEDGQIWGCSVAERGGEKWRLLERYQNDTQTHVSTDASAWFWQAMLHPSQGPWTAVTMIEQLPDEAALAMR